MKKYELHYCIGYVPIYSCDCRFKHCRPAINHLFDWLNCRCGVYSGFYHNTNGLSSAGKIDWSKEGVHGAINILNDMIKAKQSWKDIPIYGDESCGDWSIDKWLRDRLVKVEKNDGITPEYVYDFLLKAVKKSDKSNAYIHFEWF